MTARGCAWAALWAALPALHGCGGGAGVDDASVPGLLDAGTNSCDYGDAATLPDGRIVGGPFFTRVVSFTPGSNAGFGQSEMPFVVMGPPVGGGDFVGGTDVVSLGAGGEIVVALDDVTITDGPGTDFIVFENPFEVRGSNPLTYFDELGEVSVSDDGATWYTFACDPHSTRPNTGCAGWNIVYSTPSNGLCATDPTVAGGDPFDLHELGITHARYVRIRDLGTQYPNPPTAGFDLDAIAVVHGAPPS